MSDATDNRIYSEKKEPLSSKQWAEIVDRMRSIAKAIYNQNAFRSSALDDLADQVERLAGAADPDPEPSRADKLRAALKPAGVKVTVLGEANEPAACQHCETWKRALEATEANRKRLELRVDELEDQAAEPPKPAHEREPPHCSSCSCGMPTPPPAASQVEEVLCAGVVVSSPHDRRITLRFETDEQFRAAEVLIGIAETKPEGSPLTVPGMQFPVETEATPVECPKSPTQFHVTKIGGQVCVYCGPESEEASP